MIALAARSIAALVAVSAAVAQPTPFEKDGKWGYRGSRGAVVIAPRYEVAQPFSAQGIAAVVDANGWAYIDRQGAILIRPFVLDNGPDYFSEDLARFVEGGKIGFFDRGARVVIQPRFDFALPFSEGLAVVCYGCAETADGEHRRRTGGKWGYIDRSGRIAIPARYEAAEPFANRKARVRMAGKWRAIRRDGSLAPRVSR